MATYKIKKKTADNGSTEEILLPISSIDGLQTELDGKVNKSGDTMTGSLTIQEGKTINVSQYNDAGGVSLMNNGGGTATQFGSSARPARMFSSEQPQWYKNGASQGVLAIKDDIKNGTLTIQKNGNSVGTFTANQSGNTTANITVPTTASDVGAAPKTAGVYLVKGNTTGTAGTWTGTSSDFTDYYDGLVVAYDIGIAGASTTTLNINDNGAKTVYLRGTTKLTTQYAVGTIILLVYSADANCWYKADYDSNGNTSVRVYRQTSGYDADYPILVSRTKTADIATVGTNNSNEGVYAVIANNGANTPTINPHTGAAKFVTVTATTFNGNLSGNATTATTADNATKLGGQAASYYENKVTSVNGKTGAVTIDIPDISGKANLSGGNTLSGNQVITGYLDIRGNAAEKHLKTRGIGGSDGNGNSSDLYLQYSSDYKTYFGNTAQSSLNADGSISITSGTTTGNLTVGGNLTVNGTTTTVDSTTLQVKDKLIEVAHGNAAALATPAGLVAPKYDGTNSGALVFDSTGTAYVGDVTLKDGNIDVANSELQPLATRTGLVGGNLVQYDSSEQTLKDSGKKIGDLALKTDLSSKANLSGGNTFTGKQTLNSPASDGYSINASGYIKGSWLQSSAISNKGSNTGKVCVFDNSGWIYYRTPAEILTEAGGAKTSDIPDVSGKANLSGGNTFNGQQIFQNTNSGAVAECVVNNTAWDSFTVRSVSDNTQKTAVSNGYVWCQDSDAIYSRFNATGIYYGNDNNGSDCTLLFPEIASGESLEKTIATTDERLFRTFVPTGTAIGSNVDLNTTTYLKVGRYYCSANVTVETLSNCPVTDAFMMEVFSPLSTTIDNETTQPWCYRLRELTTYSGHKYFQVCYTDATANVWTYNNWTKVAKTSDIPTFLYDPETKILTIS